MANTLNLDPDPGFCSQFRKTIINNNLMDEQFSLKTIFLKTTVYKNNNNIRTVSSVESLNSDFMTLMFTCADSDPYGLLGIRIRIYNTAQNYKIPVCLSIEQDNEMPSFLTNIFSFTSEKNSIKYSGERKLKFRAKNNL